jgi:CHASE2 domain-containing sensor protein
MWQPVALCAAWAGLAVVFGWAWLRGGNGAWRWRSRVHDPNAPLFGLIAVACLTGVGWYAYLIGHRPPSSSTVALYRVVREVPLLGVFLTVALVRGLIHQPAWLGRAWARLRGLWARAGGR